MSTSPDGAGTSAAGATDYRTDIDGLRAIAVLSIIAFHAGFAWCRGGFRGVDMFFVISGFLITGIVLRELSAGRFSLLGFYERRARRILPALFVMLLVSAAVAYRVLMPADLRVFAQNFVAIIGFSSNVLFWRRAGGFDFYFEPSAKLNPLLHTWSLGVEEQFYVVFPLMLALGWALWRLRVFWLVALTAVASMVLCLTYGSGWLIGHPSVQAEFYLLPFRAWELALGALVVFAKPSMSASPTGSWRCEVLSGVGLVAIVASMLHSPAHDPSFPALMAVPSTVGTALILAVGRGTLAGRLLSMRSLVFVGLISYSAYLWHQPIFAFAHYLSLNEALSNQTTLALCAVTGLVGALSWYFIETPFRDRRRVSRRAVVICSAASAVVLLAVALPFAVRRQLPMRGRMLTSSALIASLSDDTLPARMRECSLDRPSSSNTDLGCVIGAPAPARPAFLVIGDSHAGSLLPAFQRMSVVSGESGRLVTLRGCPPLFGVLAEVSAACQAVQEQALAFAVGQGIARVYLVARWAGYTDGDYDGHIDYYLSEDGWKGSHSRVSSRTAIVNGLHRTVMRYAAARIPLLIVEQVPQQRARPLGLYLQAFLRHDPTAFLRASELTRGAHDTLQSYMSAVFAPYRRSSAVRFINLSDALCDNRSCEVGTADESYYWDVSHLSETGARRVSDALIAQSAPPLAR